MFDPTPIITATLPGNSPAAKDCTCNVSMPTSTAHSLADTTSLSADSSLSAAAVPPGRITAPTTNASPANSTSESAPSVGKSSRKRAQTDDTQSDDDERSIKRKRNTIASRKYRQKRLDRLADLEERLAAVTEERDGLRIQLARREAEVDALRNGFYGR